MLNPLGQNTVLTWLSGQSRIVSENGKLLQHSARARMHLRWALLSRRMGGREIRTGQADPRRSLSKST